MEIYSQIGMLLYAITQSFKVGFGIGWSQDEYQASNILFQNRGKRADEFIQVLKRIWTDDVVEFKGKYYSIPASKIAPKPLQKPHPPIYMGGFSPNTFLRIVNYDTNGWLAVTAGPLEYLDNTIKNIKDIANKSLESKLKGRKRLSLPSKFGKLFCYIYHFIYIFTHWDKVVS